MNNQYSAVGGSKEGILSIFKQTEQSETTLRYSSVRYSAVLRFAFKHLNPEPFLFLLDLKRRETYC
jgi:hypothetical protein